MARRKRSRNIRWLISLVVVAAAYAAWILSRPPGSDFSKLVGLFGVALGLFIGAQPVANFLELLLFSRSAGLEELPKSLIVVWLFANLLALAAGWFTIMIGAIRFTTA
jgi:hypothetical protein